MVKADTELRAGVVVGLLSGKLTCSVVAALHRDSGQLVRRPNWDGAGMISYPIPLAHRVQNVKAWLVGLVWVGFIKIESRHSSGDLSTEIVDKGYL